MDQTGSNNMSKPITSPRRTILNGTYYIVYEIGERKINRNNELYFTE